MNASHWPSGDQAGARAIDLWVVSCCGSEPSQRMSQSSLAPLRSEMKAMRDRNGPGWPVSRRTISLARVCAMVAASALPAWKRRE